MTTDIHTALREGTERVALFIKTGHFDGYVTFEVSLAYVIGEYSAIAFYSRCCSTKHKYNGVVICAQMDVRHENPYGWDEIEFLNPMVAKLSRSELEDAAKCIRSIENKLAKLAAAEGHCRSFIEYITRFARVLKVQGFYVRSGNGSLPYTQGTQTLRDTLQNLIDEKTAFLKGASQDHAA